MQAIEFETYLDNGIIRLPCSYQYWQQGQQGQQVKVIILGNDEIAHSLQQTRRESTLSCLELIQDDIGILEDAPSGLSINSNYLKDYGQ